MARTTKELMQIAWEIAHEYGIKCAQEQAQEILDKHPEYIEFITEDGVALFTKANEAVPGRIDEISLDNIPDAEALEKFISYWDDRLEITGKEIRLMQKGAVRTEGDTYAHMPTPTEGT